MKYKIGIPLLIIAALAAFFSFRYTSNDVSGDQRKKIVLQTVMDVLNEAHFSPRPLDDTFSARIFDKMLENSDYDKKLFTAEDIKALSQYRYAIDDQIKAQSFDYYNAFSEILKKRTAEAEGYYRELIKKPFSFKNNEELQLSGEKIDYPASQKEMKERWYLYIKYRVLSKYVDLKKAQEDNKKRRDTAKVNIDTSKLVIKSDVQLEEDARKSVEKNLNQFFKRTNKVDDDERFAIYINAITLNEDPHTDYFPPQQKKDFDVQMSGEFFGIGAQLKEEEGKVKIASIITGSPCWKQGELKAEDEILKVGQGSAEPEEVQGFEIDEVVKRIRGEKGTEVRLTVRKIDGSVRVIPIIRGKVELDETFAKSAVINTAKGPVGYISLIEFYFNVNSNDGRRCSEDVAKEIAKLKNAGVKGIILDLRYNGGGSLNDVVDMCGLFVNRGPIVQIKSSDANPMTLSTRNNGIAYDGPFVIMVNQGSASASEIMAAAMQDYKRAVIVGSPTFGKGTVQKQVPLDEVIDPIIRMKMQNNNLQPIGALKLTIQKFYRINGGSTQLKGVTPDIILPDLYSEIEVGERKDKAALPWDEIRPATYAIFNTPPDVPYLSAQSQQRVANNALFDAITQNAKRLKKLEDDNMVSLNEIKYRKQQEEAQDLSKRMDSLDKKVTLLDMTNLQEDMERINRDSSYVEKNKTWLRVRKKDVYLSETVNIVDDMIK
jgi:carboxyl-terminal processing protease